MLQLIDISVSFPKRKRGRVTALDGINFSLHEGEFVTVTGPSGSGKTTFIQVCAGFMSPTAGQVLFRGQSLSAMDDARISSLRGTVIGFVFQFFNLLDHLTVLENVALPLVFQGTPLPERLDRAGIEIERLGLTDRASHYPHELSGGECQRVAIARALVTEPALIIADEPTGNLDHDNSLAVMRTFSTIVAERGVAILLVTHDPGVAGNGHRCVRLEKGRLQ